MKKKHKANRRWSSVKADPIADLRRRARALVNAPSLPVHLLPSVGSGKTMYLSPVRGTSAIGVMLNRMRTLEQYRRAGSAFEVFSARLLADMCSSIGIAHVWDETHRVLTVDQPGRPAWVGALRTRDALHRLDPLVGTPGVGRHGGNSTPVLAPVARAQKSERVGERGASK